MKKAIVYLVLFLFLFSPSVYSSAYSSEGQSLNITIQKNEPTIDIDENYYDLRRLTQNNISRFIKLTEGEKINITKVGYYIKGESYSVYDDESKESYYKLSRNTEGVSIDIYLNDYDKVDGFFLYYKLEKEVTRGSDLTYTELPIYSNSKNTIKIDTLNLRIGNYDESIEGLWQSLGEKSKFEKVYSSITTEKKMGINEDVAYIVSLGSGNGAFNNIKISNESYGEKFSSLYGENIITSRDTKEIRDNIFSDSTNVIKIILFVFASLILFFISVILKKSNAKKNSDINIRGEKEIIEQINIPSLVNSTYLCAYMNNSEKNIVCTMLIDLLENKEIELVESGFRFAVDKDKVPNPRKKLYDKLIIYTVNDILTFSQLEHFMSLDKYFSTEVLEINNELNDLIEEEKGKKIIDKLNNAGLNQRKWLGYKRALMKISERELENRKVEELPFISKYMLALDVKNKSLSVHSQLNPLTLTGIEFYKIMLQKVKGDKLLIDYIMYDLGMGGSNK